MSQITGLGGVFIKFNDPKAMNEWYSKVLGLNTNDYGVLFRFNERESNPGFLQLGTFTADSNYFGKDAQKVMLNFRVDKLEDFLERLKADKVKIVDEVEAFEYGKFVHIEDPEGNRIELWEPVDAVFGSENYHSMY